MTSVTTYIMYVTSSESQWWKSLMQVIRRDVDECSDYSSLLGGEEGGGAVDLNAGYIQHCIVDQGFEKIHEYDLYR